MCSSDLLDQTRIIGLIARHRLVRDFLPAFWIFLLDFARCHSEQQFLERKNILANQLAAGLLPEASVTAISTGFKEDHRVSMPVGIDPPLVQAQHHCRDDAAGMPGKSARGCTNRCIRARKRVSGQCERQKISISVLPWDLVKSLAYC